MWLKLETSLKTIFTSNLSEILTRQHPLIQVHYSRMALIILSLLISCEFSMILQIPNVVVINRSLITFTCLLYLFTGFMFYYYLHFVHCITILLCFFFYTCTYYIVTEGQYFSINIRTIFLTISGNSCAQTSLFIHHLLIIQCNIPTWTQS